MTQGTCVPQPCMRSNPKRRTILVVRAGGHPPEPSSRDVTPLLRSMGHDILGAFESLDAADEAFRVPGAISSTT